MGTARTNSDMLAGFVDDHRLRRRHTLICLGHFVLALLPRLADAMSAEHRSDSSRSFLQATAPALIPALLTDRGSMPYGRGRPAV